VIYTENKTIVNYPQIWGGELKKVITNYKKCIEEYNYKNPVLSEP